MKHFLQLRDRVAFSPDLGAAVAGLVEAGLLDQGLSEAHDLLTRMLVATRLLAPDLAVPPAAAGEVLGLPEGYRVEMAFVIGKQGDVKQLPEMLQEREVVSTRKPVSEIAFAGPFKV